MTAETTAPEAGRTAEAAEPASAEGAPAVLAARLSEALAELRGALLAGQLDRLSEMAPRLEALAARLEAMGRDGGLAGHAVLARIAAEAGACAPLANAACEEIRSVRHRLQEIARARNHLDTYGPSGLRQDLARALPGRDWRR